MSIFINLAQFYFRYKVLKTCTLDVGSGSNINYRKIGTKKGTMLIVGHSSIINGSMSFDRENGRIVIGDRTFIGASNIICAENITIGNDVLISWGCTLVDHDSHSLNWNARKNDVVAWHLQKKDWTGVIVRPIRIGDKAWIGFNSIILKGIQIGEGAIVGAGSVVTKDVAPYTIVAGNPARVIREIPVNER